MTTGFSDRVFALGSLTGIRQFTVGNDDHLYGLHFVKKFKPGENVAVCHAERNHEGTAVKDCTCGFYAYFDSVNLPRDSTRVTTLIDGHGVTTVGSKGFRASKASILAIVNPYANEKPPTTRSARIQKHVYDNPEIYAPIMVAGVVFGIVGFVLSFITSAAFGILGVCGIAISILIMGMVGRSHNDLNEYVGITREAYDKVCKTYPEAKVYVSLADAIAAHPLSTEPAFKK